MKRSQSSKFSNTKESCFTHIKSDRRKLRQLNREHSRQEELHKEAFSEALAKLPSSPSFKRKKESAMKR